MKRSLIIISLLMLSFFVVGCSTSIQSVCNDKLLNAFLESPMNPMNVVDIEPTVKGASELMVSTQASIEQKHVGELSWTIQEQGDQGCLIYLSADINGIPTISPSFYFNLETSEYYADDELSEFLIEAQGTYPTGGIYLNPNTYR